jgi:hypothetical protein
MSDQEERPESHAEAPEDGNRYRDYPASVLSATRDAGAARGLDQATNPLYAHLLNVAWRLDDPWLQDQYVSALSNEFRQIVKQLGLANAESGKKGDVSILSSLGSNIKRPTRPA